jgi:hypothetical protein
VTIGNSVTTIGNGAFANNTYLTTVSIPDGLTNFGDKVFENNYSLTSILYCGKLTDFPVTPTCPPERQVLIDAAKAAADAKVAGELKAKQEAELKAAAAKAAAAKKTTITCVKGKLTKKVTAVKPKCPSGYKVKR